MLGTIASLYGWLRLMLVKQEEVGSELSFCPLQMKGLTGALNGFAPSPGNLTASTEVQQDLCSIQDVPVLVTDMRLSDARGSKKETTLQIHIRSWSRPGQTAEYAFTSRSRGPLYSHQAIICFPVSPTFDVYCISHLRTPSPGFSPVFPAPRPPSPGPIPWGPGVDKPEHMRPIFAWTSTTVFCY